MKMTEEQNTIADALFSEAQDFHGGRLEELHRYVGDDHQVGVHVCTWFHNSKGQFIVDENWHLSE